MFQIQTTASMSSQLKEPKLYIFTHVLSKISYNSTYSYSSTTESSQARHQHKPLLDLLYAGSLLGLLFNPDDRGDVPRKRQLTFNRLHSVISQKTGFIKNKSYISIKNGTVKLKNEKIYLIILCLTDHKNEATQKQSYMYNKCYVVIAVDLNARSF
jgi:hypothetical protein